MLDYSRELILQERGPEQIIIIIHPLSSGLYAVYIPVEMSKISGSLMEYTILAKNQLGAQIRRCVTIAHCWIATKMENGYWREPHYLQRKKKSK